MTRPTMASLPSVTLTPRRFGYMTGSVEHLQTARKLALPFGCIVDMLPLDAPPPEPGTYDGIMVDFAPAQYALARKTFLEKLVRMAKVFPIVVYDLRTNYQEAAAMRSAGIKWLPVLNTKAFAIMLAHPLAQANATRPEPETEIELCEDSQVNTLTE